MIVICMMKCERTLWNEVFGQIITRSTALNSVFTNIYKK